MDYVFKDNIEVADYIRLRAAVGWVHICEEQAAAGLRHTQKIVACYAGDRIIGSARIIWDGGYVAYLADVMVMPEAQGHGVGKEMVSRLIQWLEKQLKPGWKLKIALGAARGKEPFYRKLGFADRPNSTDGAGMERWLYRE